MTDADLPGRAPPVCAQCGTQIAPALLACPSCQRLVHSNALKRLAAGAERTAHAGDTSAALAAWRQALELLPPDSSQRSEEHTSELQSQSNLVCRLLLEKKKKNHKQHDFTPLHT